MTSDAADETRPRDPGTMNGRDQAAEAAGAEADDDSPVMDLLSEHVPLSLIVDLTSPEGPASEEILESEGVPDDSWWVTDAGEDLGSVGEGLDDGGAAAEGDDVAGTPSPL